MLSEKICQVRDAISVVCTTGSGGSWRTVWARHYSVWVKAPTTSRGKSGICVIFSFRTVMSPVYWIRATSRCAKYPDIVENLSIIRDRASSKRNCRPGGFVWDIGNYDSELLLTSCRRALVSLSPSATALHDVARQYGLRASNAGMTLGFLRDSFVPVMSHYLQDPDSSFIAVRHLSALQRKRPSASSLKIYTETLLIFQQLGIMMVERAVYLPETVEWPFFDDFVRGNLYTGQVMIRYIGGILFSAPQRIPKVVRFLVQILSVDQGKTQFNGDPSWRQPEDPYLTIWRAHVICTLLESQTGDSKLDSHLQFIACLSEETRYFFSTHNLPFCNASASSFAYWHKLWTRPASHLGGRTSIRRQMHDPVPNTNALYLSYNEFLRWEGRIMMDPGNLIPKAWKLVGRQKQPRLPSPFLRRRKSMDFAESAVTGRGKYSGCEVRLQFVQ